MSEPATKAELKAAFLKVPQKVLADTIGVHQAEAKRHADRASAAKEAFVERGLARARGDAYVVTLSEGEGTRFDTVSFKADHPDIYAQYLMASRTKKWSVDPRT